MQGAIFDMDGLLLDSEAIFQRVWRDLARENGVTLDEYFTPSITGSGQAEMDGILRKYYPNCDPVQLDEECKRRVYRIEEHELPLKSGVVELLTGLQCKDLRLSVASSSPLPMIKRNLQKTDILRFFEVVVSGDEVKRGKPFPDVFLYAAEKLGLPPETCYVFEDSLNGIRAAHAAKCKPVMIPDLVSPTDEIRAICRVYPDLSAAWQALKNELGAH